MSEVGRTCALQPRFDAAEMILHVVVSLALESEIWVHLPKPHTRHAWDDAYTPRNQMLD